MKNVPALMGVLIGCFAVGAALPQQLSNNPFPQPIEATRDVITVNYVEFAKIPDAADEAPRLMHLVDEPETQRLFVSTMRGMLYSISYDGKAVVPYLDINAEQWRVSVQFDGFERGLQSFAFHPQFAQTGAPGYGKFYTYTDTTNTAPKADFESGSQERTHDTVLLEWTARNASSPTYDGSAPRELFRAAQPFRNHNGGMIGFNPLASPNSAEFGLLYVGFADGGSGGDPLKVAQNLSNAFGKILRIDPLGSNGRNGKYGIPASNPFVDRTGALDEIFVYGVRNPQRFTWDTKDGRMYLAEIGQNQVEEISPVTAGANLGWNLWEGSFRFNSNRQVDLASPRSAPGMTWPVIEYDHTDPILLVRAGITGLVIYRVTGPDAIPALANLMIFGDIPSGEIFYVNADRLPKGGQADIRRILFKDKGAAKTLLQLINEHNATQGKPEMPRADLRFGFDTRGRIYVMNKRDGLIRLLVR